MYEQPVFQGPVAGKKGQGNADKSPRMRDHLESVSIVERGNQEESSLLPDRQHNSCVLSLHGWWHPLQETEWPCKEHFPQMLLESNTLILNIPLLICQLANPGTNEKHSNLCSL